MCHHTVHHKWETFLDKLLDAVPGLTRLTILDVSLPYSLDNYSFYWTKIGIINAGWPFFAVNITTLSLDIPLEEIHLVLLSHITLLQLESFFIFLHIFFPTYEPNGLIWNTLLSFLLDHGLTLSSLRLEALKKVDISSILAGLQHMPHLNSLHISHPFLTLGLMNFVGHHQFLEAHQLQLQYLTFNFVVQSLSSDIANKFFNQEWCDILLPGLQSLSFCFLCLTVSHDDAADTTIPYFQQHIPTVKSLIIHTLHFSYNQVASILTGPKYGEYQLTVLRMLDIQIQCFSPAFLSLLIDKAPQLWLLKLNMSIIGPDKQPKCFRRSRVPELGHSIYLLPRK